ncbi:YqgE/AlgH family protein [Salibacter halophilus]|uniref:YqgE/AlgH family protein n=1 Tax=Salibacter halophilus TaxID=1803916 RepID=A0A6N6M7F5_9FLAO|nr:YqgE/AlgH family protein [Salibacter halophilus]KAB1066000.1 YqgE/AlgH family protein [Salibacter halophilus]
MKLDADFFDNINYELQEPKAGNILISDPFLPDPNFSRTVVLLTEHNEEGSLGFVLNRESDFKLSSIIDDITDFDANIYVGGPVGLNQLFYIHRMGDVLQNSKKIIDGVHWGGDFDQLKFYIETKQVKPGDIRFFAGYSGWSPGQLEAEIKEKTWIVAPIEKEQIMKESEDYWKEILSGLGNKFKVMSNFPEDPNLN